MGISFTVFQVATSTTVTTPSRRLGVAMTRVPSRCQVMPDPRCGRPGQLERRDGAAHVEVHHLAALAVAARAHDLAVVRREEEIVEHVLELRAARIEEAGTNAPSFSRKSCTRPTGMSSAFGS